MTCGKESTEVKLADAARCWRQRSSWGRRKAYSDMRAALMMPDQKKAQFEKLITAGGGQVVQEKTARSLLHHDDNGDTNAPEVTHVFTESAYIRKEKVDYYGLAVRGVPVLNHLFLYDLLTLPYESPSLTNHMLDEAKPHWAAQLTVAEEFLNSCFNGSLDGVRSALLSGVNVNTRDAWDSERASSSGVYSAFVIGMTGLMWAVLRKHNSVVELLLGSPRIDINAKNRNDQT